MIWLPRTTDNSTYFAQSLEIRGIESRLYRENIKILHVKNYWANLKIIWHKWSLSDRLPKLFNHNEPLKNTAARGWG